VASFVFNILLVFRLLFCRGWRAVGGGGWPVQLLFRRDDEKALMVFYVNKN